MEAACISCISIACILRTVSNLHFCFGLGCAAMSEWEVPRRLEEPEKEKKQRWRLERGKEKNRKMCSRESRGMRCDRTTQ